MPFIDSKVSVKITPEQKKELKARLGEAIGEDMQIAGPEDIKKQYKNYLSRILEIY